MVEEEEKTRRKKVRGPSETGGSIQGLSQLPPLYFCDVPNTASTRPSYSPQSMEFHTPPARKAFPPQKPAKLALTYQFSAPASVTGTCVFRVACMRPYY